MSAAAANRRRVALGANGAGAGKLWRREPRPPCGIRPERAPRRVHGPERYGLPPEAEVRERADYLARCIGFTLDELREPSRVARRVAARLFIAAKLHDHGASYPQIGRALNRDHSTLIQGLRRFPCKPPPRGGAMSERTAIRPEDCPEPFWHETHRYCPVCTWREEPEPTRDAARYTVEEIRERLLGDLAIRAFDKHFIETSLWDYRRGMKAALDAAGFPSPREES